MIWRFGFTPHIVRLLAKGSLTAQGDLAVLALVVLGRDIVIKSLVSSHLGVMDCISPGLLHFARGLLVSIAKITARFLFYIFGHLRDISSTRCVIEKELLRSKHRRMSLFHCMWLGEAALLFLHSVR